MKDSSWRCVICGGTLDEEIPDSGITHQDYYDGLLESAYQSTSHWSGDSLVKHTYLRVFNFTVEELRGEKRVSWWWTRRDEDLETEDGRKARLDAQSEVFLRETQKLLKKLDKDS